MKSLILFIPEFRSSTPLAEGLKDIANKYNLEFELVTIKKDVNPLQQQQFLYAVHVSDIVVVDCTIPSDVNDGGVYPALTAQVNILNHIIVVSENNLPLNITPLRGVFPQKDGERCTIEHILKKLPEQIEQSLKEDTYSRIPEDMINDFLKYQKEMEEMFDASLEIAQRDWDPKNMPTDILFDISFGELRTQYRIIYSAIVDGDLTRYSYSVEKLYGPKISFRINQVGFDDIVDYFNSEKRSPVIFFADGSMLYANNYITLRQVTTPFNPDDLISYDWDGVDLNAESMDWPHKKNSIQYFVWQKIRDQYELVFDDDGSGEIADLIGVNQDAKTIFVNLYHLKFAEDGKVSKRISNFYEVCGQAQ